MTSLVACNINRNSLLWPGANGLLSHRVLCKICTRSFVPLVFENNERNDRTRRDTDGYTKSTRQGDYAVKTSRHAFGITRNYRKEM